MKKCNWYFWFGLAAVSLFLILSDVRILLFSDQSFLYGVQTTFHSRFEESILYTPLISNVDFFHFFKIDYFGADTTQAIAPYPYFAIALFGLLYRLTDFNLNWSIVLIHSLVIVEYVVAYALSKRLGASRWLATVFGLLLTSYMYIFPLTLLAGLFGFGLLAVRRIAWSKLAILGSSVLVAVGLTYMVISRFTALSTAFLKEPVLLKQAVTKIVPLALNGFQGSQVYEDTFITRFISPLLPMLILFTSVYLLVWAYQYLQHKDKSLTWWQWVGLVVALSANAYTYYFNVLLLAPLVVLWVVLLRRRQQLWVWVLAAVLMIPFVFSVVMSKLDPAYADLAYRGAAQGSEISTKFNYEVMPLEYWLALAGLVVLYGWWSKWQKKLNFTLLVGPLLYASVMWWVHFNYLVADTIPQAPLLSRFLVPTLILALLPIAVRISQHLTQPWLKVGGQVYVHGLMVLVSLNLVVMGVGRFNLHQEFTGPANAAVVDDLNYVKPWLTSDTILVSNRPQVNLLAPGTLGVRTLLPNPIITLGTHESFLSQYAAQTQLLGGDVDAYLEVIRNGMAHSLELQPNPGTALFTQSQGTAYPIPHDWVKANDATIRQVFSDMTTEKALTTWQPIYLYLIDQEIDPSLAERFTLIVTDGSRRLYREIN